MEAAKIERLVTALKAARNAANLPLSARTRTEIYDAFLIGTPQAYDRIKSVHITPKLTIKDALMGRIVPPSPGTLVDAIEYAVALNKNGE